MVKRLKTNTNIYYTRPDKGAGAVVINCSDYIRKMLSILNDGFRFQFSGDLSFDDILKMEIKTLNHLLKLYKSEFISRDVYERIHSV